MLARFKAQEANNFLRGHLVELRRRLLVYLALTLCLMVIIFFFSDQLFILMLKPLVKAYAWHGYTNGGIELIYTAPLEFFITKLKLSVLGGFLLSLPIFLWQLAQFIMPGLYQMERRFFLAISVSMLVLLLLAASLVYFVFLPSLLLLSLDMQHIGGEFLVNIKYLGSVENYWGLLVKLLLACGVLFQLPVLIIILVYFRLFTVAALKSYRKFVILSVFILAAILTPPDILSQLILAIPSLLLYELAVIIAIYIEKRRKIS